MSKDTNSVKSTSKKKLLAYIGLGVAVGFTAVVCYSNREAIGEHIKLFKATNLKANLEAKCQSVIAKCNQPKLDVDNSINLAFSEEKSKQIQVNDFIRNLHKGWNPSPEKIASAEVLGIKLKPGQTWVSGYTKNQRIA